MKMRPLLKNPDEYNDPPRPFFEHIVALRECLIHAVLAWAICCILVGVFSPSVLGWLKAPAAALEAAGKIKIVSLNLTGRNAEGIAFGIHPGDGDHSFRLLLCRNRPDTKRQHQACKQPCQQPPAGSHSFLSHCRGRVLRHRGGIRVRAAGS